MSIGDVLNQLRDEFPDITISKIRFLESQGLVEPERTPSGYRKFYAADVERLRFILRQQREHFLPLKVIKDRLDEVDRAGDWRCSSLPTRAPVRRGPAGRRSRRAAPTPRRRGKRPSKEPVLFEETRKAREQAEAREVDGRRRPTRPAPTTSRRPESGVSLTPRRAGPGRRAHRRGARPARGVRARRAHAHGTRDRVLFDEDALAVARIAAGLHAARHRAAPPPHVPRVRRTRSRRSSNRCCCRTAASATPKRRRARPRRSASSPASAASLRTVMLRQAVRRGLGG